MTQSNTASLLMTQISHKDHANAIRFLAMDAVEKAQSGHPGMPMGMADVATVLFQKFLKFDASCPLWPDRDRFVLSNGHGSMLLYALGYLTGYEKMTLEELKHFRQWGAHTAGHPEHNPSLGIETTTGPLGQGLGNAVGMALAERILNASFGDALVNHYTYAFVGDGCLMEGISHEAISLAGHLGLGKLIVFFDNNSITIDGSTDLSVSDNQKKRFEACGWDVYEIDGHAPDAIEKAIESARNTETPSLISCRTVIGFGAPTKAGTASTHGAPLGSAEIEATRQALGWKYPPFEIPDALLTSWRSVGKQHGAERKAWEKRLNAHPKAEDFNRRQQGDLPKGWSHSLETLREEFIKTRPSLATRKASERVIESIWENLPELIGGSADLTGSNNTKAKSMRSISKQSFEGSYIYYGVREHGMAAAMNGLALHGGLIPYGGTFLVFTDYCRPSIRLAALMRQRVIYVMTHDSIGLGEDGPTHQPVEHLASLRAIPHLRIYRPADGVETAACWESALHYTEGPSVIALTRQNISTVCRDSHPPVSKGAYVLAGDPHAPVTLIATGSEVSLALAVMEALKKDTIMAKVISAPCLEIFDEQDEAYKQSVLGVNSFKISIEAASPQSWYKYVGDKGLIIGIEDFGASAPYEDLMVHFGFTAEAIRAKILSTYKKYS